MGAGHGGLAMAGHLGIMGFEVRLFNRTAARLDAVRMAGGIHVTGDDIDGFGKVAIATERAEEALTGADVVMVVVPATGHQYMAEQCAPHLADGQIVVLNPGRTFGAIEFVQTLKRQNSQADVTVGETQTFVYASRITGPAQVRVFRVKNAIPLATVRAHSIPQCLSVVRQAFPQFVPGDSVFKTSFNNIGAVFHPAIMLLNTGWVEDAADFEFYHQGVTPSVAHILEELDAERCAVAAALGFRAMSAREWLYYAYDAAGRDLREAMRANMGYRGIQAPHRMEMRYLSEDVPCSLVPMVSLGAKFGVPVPAMNSLVELASIMHGRDYRAEGRNLEKLGISDMDLKQLRLLAIGELDP
ncbi:MAG: NAD/NADP octopine/nopaline dehydrogenase family protein [Candidatus Hydrogenedentes bacterium]|nr:NAD/NADP octopine/nopaline dehydrogenase family protein [Candidatus Hydrogenedentota bacterium]